MLSITFLVLIFNCFQLYLIFKAKYFIALKRANINFVMKKWHLFLTCLFRVNK